MPVRHRLSTSPALTALVCCFILAPLWMLTMFHRGLWTPDEPREADITWRMAHQPEHAVPSLAGQPFLEKPPLAYWLAAPLVVLFPQHAAAMRAPNFLYACATTFAIAWLVFETGGALGASIAALAGGTFLLSLQVTSWLATDAALMMGVTLALLGFYRAIVQPPGRAKLAWYALMHSALAWTFLAKGPGAWLVPVIAAGAFIVFERSWRELKRWELWLPALIPAAAILAWLLAVERTQDGAHDLGVLLWYNVVGRAIHLHALDAAAYVEGHRNWPGKYLLELPFYLAPWTFLFIAAVRRTWHAGKDPDARLERFALCAWGLPFLVLSCASTARGIYAAPTLPAAAVLIGLWFSKHHATLDRFERVMLRATLALVVLWAVILFGGAIVIQAAESQLRSYALILGAAFLVTLGLILYGRVQLACKQASRFLAATLGAFLVAALAGCWVLFPAIDSWHDLPALARQIDRDAGNRDLVLFAPDETTVALIDRDAPGHQGRWRVMNTLAHSAVIPESGGASLLVLLPGHAEGPLTHFLGAMGFKGRPRAPDAVLSELHRSGGFEVERIYSLPYGRRYALLDAPPAHARTGVASSR